MNSTHF